MLDRNKILSKEKRKGSCRIVLPTNKSRLAMSEGGDSKVSLTNSGTGKQCTNDRGNGDEQRRKEIRINRLKSDHS